MKGIPEEKWGAVPFAANYGYVGRKRAEEEEAG